MGIFHTTPEGKLVDANPHFARTIGYDTPEDLIEAVNKEGIASLYGDSARRAVVSREALGSGGWHTFEGRYKRRDGSYGFGRMRLRAYISPGGAPPQIEGFMEDLTEQKSLQDRLLRTERLEGLVQLARGIGHQFNNIHAVVQGFLEVAIADPSLPEPHRSHLGKALEAARRATGITSALEILTTGSSRAGEALVLEEVLVPVLGRSRKEAADQGVRMELDLSTTGPVIADRSMLEFVLNSLLSNALHAVLDRPTRLITVRTRSADGGSRFEVSDTGCGIQPSDMSKLFTPFFSTKGEWALSGSPQAKVRGMGLSLAICRSLLSGFGGRLEVSTANAGSTFAAWLPALRTDA